MSSRFLPRGVERCSAKRFLLWIAPWAVVLGLGLYASFLILWRGLNQTNMDNRFAFGIWIFLDLAVIAMGAGAFFTGFLVYILRREDLKPVLSSAVVLGFICYSGAIAILMLDVGQPLRAWFTFWHPNVHSMLTEVTFCLTFYLIVLALEYVPIVLKGRAFRTAPSLFVFEFRLHKAMPALAAVGCLLSFFHQGSLGGLYGVLRGRPFAYREGFAIWPSTFFLFVLSAIAVGPSFVLLTTWLVSRITGNTLIRPEVYRSLGRISGKLLALYVCLKGADTLLWINRTAPSAGFQPFFFYRWQPFGTWILFAEIVLFGLVPALALIDFRGRRSVGTLVAASGLACAGVLLNRFVMTIQTLSLPTMSFDRFLTYVPSWQEVAAFGAVVAYGVALYSLSYRYLPLFPQERELKAR
jgi:molybdopterin-containing oxidoreductase family membrane subunit